MSSIMSPAGGVPAGTTIEFSGTTPPPGYLEENGATVSRTTYAALFMAIGTTHGAGDGVTTFALPDSRRRTSVGAGGAGSAQLGNAVGNVGGAETVALVADNNGPHSHGITYAGIAGSPYTSVSAASSVTSSGTVTGSSGLGTPHNNLPPSIVKMKCIKY